MTAARTSEFSEFELRDPLSSERVDSAEPCSEHSSRRVESELIDAVDDGWPPPSPALACAEEELVDGGSSDDVLESPESEPFDSEFSEPQ